MIKEIAKIEQQQYRESKQPGGPQGYDGQTGFASKEQEQPPDAEPPTDSKSFSQRLFSTSTWQLSAFIESYRGKYRMLPPWAVDTVTKSVIEAMSDWELVYPGLPQQTPEQVRQAPPQFSVHPRIGIWSYSFWAEPGTDAKKAISPSALGRLLFSDTSRRIFKQKRF